MRRDKTGYIYIWVAHVARQGGHIIMHVWRDKASTYFIIAHVARQGWLCQGLICDDLWPGGILFFVVICEAVYISV